MPLLTQKRRLTEANAAATHHNNRQESAHVDLQPHGLARHNRSSAHPPVPIPSFNATILMHEPDGRLLWAFPATQEPVDNSSRSHTPHSASPQQRDERQHHTTDDRPLQEEEQRPPPGCAQVADAARASRLTNPAAQLAQHAALPTTEFRTASSTAKKLASARFPSNQSGCTLC